MHIGYGRVSTDDEQLHRQGDALTAAGSTQMFRDEGISDTGIALVNRWLHREVGMAVHTTVAHFDATTFCWRLPIDLAYAARGRIP
jgi:hypothetical protein